MQQLQQCMSAHEFAQHYLLEQADPLHPIVQWPDPDAPAQPASDAAQDSVEQIMARARRAGMVT